MFKPSLYSGFRRLKDIGNNISIPSKRELTREGRRFRVLLAMNLFEAGKYSKHWSLIRTTNARIEHASNIARIVFGIIVGAVIGMLIFIARVNYMNGNISELAYRGLICNSIAGIIAFYVSLYRLNRRLLVFAVILFVFGIFFVVFNEVNNPKIPLWLVNQWG